MPDLDIISAFNPLAGMHAALDRIGAGMPCGLVARFTARTPEAIDAAILKTSLRFPVLHSRLAWVGGRPVLTPLPDSALAGQRRITTLQPDFRAENQPWCYQLVREGADVWLVALWAHAVADGTSTLRFLATVNELGAGRPAPSFQDTPPACASSRPLWRWLPRFLAERYLPYLAPARAALPAPDASWVSLSTAQSAAITAAAAQAGVTAGVWLAAASCMTYCEQQTGGLRGRVSLNLPVLQNNLAPAGGFGFGVGSLLLPVRLRPGATPATVAQRITARRQEMLTQGWQGSFQHFLGNNPRRHAAFAGQEAKRRPEPRVTVSWKSNQTQLGGADGLRDIACFAASPVLHVSGHIDRNGISISVMSRQAPACRVAFLRLLLQRLGAAAPFPVPRSLMELLKPTAPQGGAETPDQA